MTSILDISNAAFQEIKARLKACGDKKYPSQLPDGTEVLDIRDVVLRKETDERVKVWLLFEGKIIEKVNANKS